MKLKENSTYLRNKITGEVIYLMWQDENRPEYVKYMTMDGIKSVRYIDLIIDGKLKEQVDMEIKTYVESLSIVVNQHNA